MIVAMSWCRHDRCTRDDLHEAHDEDFILARKRRTKRDHVAKVLPPIVRVETHAVAKHMPHEQQPKTGPLAFVECPECHGGGCAECNETGEMSLLRWHLWKRQCG